MARPLQLPARGAEADELRRLAVLDRVLAAARALRDRRRVERVRAPVLPRGRRSGRRLAAFAAAAARRGARRRARVRARSVPFDPDFRRTSARAGRDAAPALALGARDPAPLARGCGDRLRAAVRAGASRARGDPLLPRLRRRAQADGSSARSVRRRAPLPDVLVWLTEIRGTTGASGRPFAQVELYSAELLDFVTRHPRHGFETFVFLGWLVPLAALAGLVLLSRRDRGLAVVLGLGVLVPFLLALGANTPVYEPLWNVVPGLGDTRVPSRFLPIACLCLAALVAFAVERVPWRYAALVAIPLVALDLRVDVYRPMGADEGNAVYARARRRPAARAARLRPRAARGKRLPLLRDPGAARAAARLLDDRAARGGPRCARAAQRQARSRRSSACAGSSSSSAECLSA